MLLKDLLRSSGIFYRAEGNENVEIKSISSDSRSTAKDSLFVCIRGRNHDAHSFAGIAAAKGAVAILAERELGEMPGGVTVIYTHDTATALARLWDAWYGHPAKGMKLVAVTGTNGKTTLTFMLDAIFSAAFHKCGIIGTVYCRTPKRLLNVEAPGTASGMTTPEPETLYRILADMRDDGAEYVFIEASSHALTLGRLAPLSFEAGVFTNLTPEHLDFHGNMENYFLAKASLLEKCRMAFINYDDSYAERYRSYAMATGCGVRIVYYSARGQRGADVKADGIKLCGSDGIAYTLRAKNTIREIRSPMPGRFNVDNTLAASSVSLEFGIAGRTVSETLSGFGGAPGRLKRVKTPSGYAASVYIDYAHTPDALKNVLETVRDLVTGEGRVILLFGCGGDRDRLKRPEMGSIASRLADVSIITSDNSRRELPEDIISEILGGFDSEKPHAVIPCRADAIKYAIGIAKEGDVVLLCGKGHEKYEIGPLGKRDFDEAWIAEEAALRNLRYSDPQAKDNKENEG